MITLTSLLVALILSHTSPVEVKAETIASHYAGMELSVECRNLNGAAGRAWIGERRIALAKDVCRALANVRSAEFSNALLTLLHEAMHHRFGVNEDVAECQGLKRLRDALSRFYGIVGLAAKPFIAAARAGSYCGAAA